MYRNLREYLSLLEREGELLTIAARVDPEGEIAEITDRVSKSPGGGKALLFTDTGTGFPVVTNIFGSSRRMALALGVENLDEIPARMESLLGRLTAPKSTFADKLRMLPLLGAAARWFPVESSSRGECQQVILRGDDAALGQLPALKCWEHDGGRFVTLPMVNTVDPVTGARNVGMYRMQFLDDHSTGMHWHVHKTGARHYEEWRRLGRRMPVSVCVGGDPAYTYSAVAPLPDGIDEYLLAGFLRGRPVKLVRCVTNDLRVPADCDFVIEGYVDPAEEKVTEGPFGDHTGFYSLEDLYPRFHVTAITHRRDAVWPATIVGVPPQEDYYISLSTEKIFIAPIRAALQPEVSDLHLPAAGVAHNLAIVAIDSRYPGQAAKVASAMWGAGQMMFNKYMVVVPSGTDIRNPEALARLLRREGIDRALVRGEGVLDVLDYATATPGRGGKLAIDLTAEAPEVTFRIPVALKAAGGIVEWDTSYVARWGVIVLRARPGEEVNAEEFVAANGIDVNFVVLFDDRTAGLDGSELLWLALGNTDPARDVRAEGGTVWVDARTKLPGRAGNPDRFPNVATSSAETIALVDARWAQYGIGNPPESPSARYRALLRSEEAEI